MDTVGDDVWKSVRLAWEAERWLPVGAVVVAIAFVFWVGLTGAAVVFLAELGVGALSIDPWTSATDVVAGVLFLCWVVAPAAVVTWLVRDRLTTVRGTLEIGYRLHHPVLLLVPPVVVLAVGTGAMGTLEMAAAPVLAVVLAGSLWFLVRVIVYSYRVFTFSVPVLTYAMAILTAGLLAVAALVVGARLIGRGALLETVATTLAVRTDSPAVLTLLRGSVEFAGVAVPALAATVIGVPVAVGVAYVAVQFAASLVARLIKPTARRPELRSGQRYPDFARPTTTVSQAATANTDNPDSTAATDAASPERTDSPTNVEEPSGPDCEPDATETDPAEASPEPELSNTRVFTAGDDAPSVSPSAVATEDRCHDCGTTLDSEGAAETCPNCGADL